MIERPLNGLLDVNGWDLAKALQLLLKGNAVIVEWLRSPILYAGTDRFGDELLDFANRHCDPRRIGRHYLHLGQRQRRTYFRDGKAVELKKIFYALRPAAALRWLRVHGGRELPPMHFPLLMEQSEAPAEVRRIAAELIAAKAQTRELGKARLPDAISRFVESEFEAAACLFEVDVEPISAGARGEAEMLFRKWVRNGSS